MQLHGFMNAIESMVMICRLSEFLITLNFNLVKDNISELKLMSLMLIWCVVICCAVLFAKHSKQQITITSVVWLVLALVLWLVFLFNEHHSFCLMLFESMLFGVSYSVNDHTWQTMRVRCQVFETVDNG